MKIQKIFEENIEKSAKYYGKVKCDAGGKCKWYTWIVRILLFGSSIFNKMIKIKPN